MQFASKEDIDAPIGHVFAEITDFQRFERAARSRGAQVQRTDGLKAPGAGMSWRAKARLRGRMRDISLQLVDYDPASGIALAAGTAMLEARITVDLVALSRARTRLAVEITLGARTLAGRLVLQSLNLARSNMTRRFRLRLADYAIGIEDRYRRAS